MDTNPLQLHHIRSHTGNIVWMLQLSSITAMQMEAYCACKKYRVKRRLFLHAFNTLEGKSQILNWLSGSQVLYPVLPLIGKQPIWLLLIITYLLLLSYTLKNNAALDELSCLICMHGERTYLQFVVCTAILFSKVWERQVYELDHSLLEYSSVLDLSVGVFAYRCN